MFKHPGPLKPLPMLKYFKNWTVEKDHPWNSKMQYLLKYCLPSFSFLFLCYYYWDNYTSSLPTIRCKSL